MFQFLPNHQKCCEEQINIVLFPVVNHNSIIVTPLTPIGWYLLFPPDGSRTQPELCYVDTAGQFIGWSNKSTEDCNTAGDVLRGGKCRVLTGFVDDFTETATVETAGVGVTDNIIIASGRHVTPKFYQHEDYISREMPVILNPKLSNYDKNLGIRPIDVDRCRMGYGMLRDQFESHVGSDAYFGTFMNVLVRVTGNYSSSQVARHPSNTADIKYIRDFIKIAQITTTRYSIEILPGYQQCCDCVDQINILSSGGFYVSGGSPVVRDVKNGSYFTVPIEVGATIMDFSAPATFSIKGRPIVVN